MVIPNYSVFDKKSKSFLPLFGARTDDEAKRYLAGAIRPATAFAQFPEDYQLMAIMEFDDETGDVVSSCVRFVCDLIELVPPSMEKYRLSGKGVFIDGETEKESKSEEGKETV